MKIDFERFAEDSIQKNTLRLSFWGTAVVWFLLLIFFAFAPGVQKKEEFKTIQITLDVPQEKTEVQKTDIASQETAASKKTQTSPAKSDAAQSAPASQKKPSVQQPAKTAQKQAASPKTSSPAPVEAKSAPAKAKITYKKSVDELLAEQSGSAKSAQWDDSVFGDDTAAVSSSSTTNSTAVNKGVSGTSALSGTAASAALDTGKAVAKTDSAVKTAATSATQNALGKIAAATYTMSAGNGVSSSAKVNVEKKGDGSVAVSMTDGSSRILLDPKKPVIFISDENAALIDSSRTVTVSFKVLAGGNVPLSGIVISPSSLLPIQIQSEIRKQISQWRFKPASSDGQARFEYSIIKK
ncbi:MAG: hypothetical protein MR876_09455 [Treponema porcinum]|uniref:hypothetical protein n=1 Tax=Treponema porcinum TaxID=261392 RepID=UPI002354EDDA|nr:hypothetical protein [Treponema porcinum]MCI6816773.1 hypothetical protein [Treponema porcinum]MDD6898529.1 hypothetical protein [Treponema porcinum]